MQEGGARPLETNVQMVFINYSMSLLQAPFQFLRKLVEERLILRKFLPDKWTFRFGVQVPGSPL
ncbi:hypothetical protein A3726_29470 [Erythrobacter sp. HI0037]|nr:hypothetical protein A3727_22090 [Erythrobacter sp. HI0038]KZY21884.1 hypothetical protein A3726_29470 [Erythrobacter sp. HI0037]